MIPKFDHFFLPCLQCLSDGKTYTQELLRAYVVDYFKLSEDDVNALVKSGKKTMVADRVQWTTSYFIQAGLVDAPKRGNYVISDLGRKFLSEHKSGFDKVDLMQIPSFARFVAGRGTKPKVLVKPSTILNNKVEESTPTDIIDDAFRQINSALAKDLLTKILEMPAAFFEKLVVELLVKMGYGGSFEDAASVTQLSRDEGIDGVIKQDKLGLDSVYIQAKRWGNNNSIGSKEIQAFVGAIEMKHASKGIFITTSYFTDPAKKCAKEVKSSIVLIDGEQLCKYMIEHNLGVSSRQVYEIKQIDSDYFEE